MMRDLTILFVGAKMNKNLVEEINIVYKVFHASNHETEASLVAKLQVYAYLKLAESLNNLTKVLENHFDEN